MLKLLSPGEIIVLRFLAEGYSNSQISDRLFVPVSKVKQDVKAILNKLGLKLLLNAGWDFITLKADRPNKMKKAKTCVNFTKKFIGMKAPFIQTPYALYKKLKRP